MKKGDRWLLASLHPTYKLKYKSINLLLQEKKPDLEIELALEKIWWLRRIRHKLTEACDLSEQMVEARV